MKKVLYGVDLNSNMIILKDHLSESKIRKILTFKFQYDNT